jgi:hypothetical protein
MIPQVKMYWPRLGKESGPHGYRENFSIIFPNFQHNIETALPY